MVSFSDRTIWITGASSGIGEALAHAWSAAGARLVLSARREARLHEVRSACTDPERHHVVPLDLEDLDSLPAIADKVLSDVGPVDVMVHNGGISQRSKAVETDASVDERLIRINYLSTVVLTKALLPSMLKRRQGHIVAISSLVGKFGSPLRTGYAASKHALHGFYDSLRAEVHDEGLRVTLVCPGFIHTQVSVNALTGDGTKQGVMDDAQANGLSPDDCARKILQAVDAGTPEVYIGGRETLGVYVKRLAPRLFNRIIRSAKVT